MSLCRSRACVRFIAQRDPLTGTVLVSRLAHPVGEMEGVTHGTPHDLRVLAVSEGLVDGPATKPGDDIVLGDALRVARPELRPHQIPERS